MKSNRSPEELPEGLRRLRDLQEARGISTKNTAKTAIDIINEGGFMTDLFHVEKLENGNYAIQVRKASESKTLGGHLRSLPIVPFVALKDLYCRIFHIDSSRKFIEGEMVGGMILPGQKLEIRADGIYSGGVQILKIRILERGPIEPANLKGFSQNFSDISHTDKKNSFEDFSLGLLQSDPFLFADWAELNENKDGGYTAVGYYDVKPSLYTKENERFESSLYEESVAQIVSLALGKICHPGDSEESGKILTFAKSHTRFSGVKLFVDDRLLVFAQISPLEKRIGSFDYFAYNRDGEEILRGTISGNITSVKGLKKLHAKIINKS